MVKFITAVMLFMCFINKASAQEGFVYIRLTTQMLENTYNYCIIYNRDTLIKSSYEQSFTQYNGIYLHIKNINKSSDNIYIYFEGRESLVIAPQAIKRIKVLELYWANKWISLIEVKSLKVNLRKLRKEYNTTIDLKTGKVSKKW